AATPYRQCYELTFAIDHVTRLVLFCTENSRPESCTVASSRASSMYLHRSVVLSLRMDVCGVVYNRPAVKDCSCRQVAVEFRWVGSGEAVLDSSCFASWDGFLGKLHARWSRLCKARSRAASGPGHFHMARSKRSCARWTFC